MSESETGLNLPQFSAVDYGVFSVLVLLSVVVGLCASYRTRVAPSVSDYFLGSDSVSPLTTSFSLLGGVISAISILGNSAEIYFFGTQVVSCFVGFVPAWAVLRYLLLPVFYNLKLVCLSQYINLRFKSRLLSCLASCVMMLNQLLVTGLVLYAPSLALSTVTRLPSWASVVIMGVVCTLYTAIGGAKSVVLADVVQTTVMVVGTLMVVIVGVVHVGGAARVWAAAEGGDRLHLFNVDPNPFIRHTVWSTICYGFYTFLYFYGVNQISYQRFAAMNSLRVANWLTVVAVVGSVLLWAIFFVAGLVAYAIYHDCDPLTTGRITKPDQILPFVVMDKLGYLTGIPGIFVAAIYGAVLSSISSSANANACLLWGEFLQDLQFFRQMKNTSTVTVLKILSLCSGGVGVLLALLSGRLGNIIQVTSTLTGGVYGPVIGLYITGICCPWVQYQAAVAGLTVSFSAMMWLMIGNLVRAKASPPQLPLATFGCPPTHANQSIAAGVVVVEEPSGSYTIYDLSYCYMGTLAIVLTLLVSNLATVVTGPEVVGGVSSELVNSACARLHRRLCGRKGEQAQPAAQLPKPGDDLSSGKEVLQSGEEWTHL